MSNLDDQIRGLFDKLNTRKTKVADLEAQISKSWITNITYRLTGATSSISLNAASAEGILDILADISIQYNARIEAAQLLGIDAPKKIQGYKFDDWVEDCKKRLASINIREEKKALAELENRLNTVLSPEERRRIEVAALMASL